MHRSYLFAPGHNSKLVDRVFDRGRRRRDARSRGRRPAGRQGAGAPDGRRRARRAARVGARQRSAQRLEPSATSRRSRRGPQGSGSPRSSRPRTCSGSSTAAGRSRPPLICAIESARGLLAAQEIASVAGVRHLSIGGVDLRRDLRRGDDALPLLHARSHLVARLTRGGPRTADRQRLPAPRRRRGPARAGRARALARLLRQVRDPPAPATDPASRCSHRRPAEVAWAREVLEAFAAAGGGATRTAAGDFVDLPVAERAQALLALAERDVPGPHEGVRGRRPQALLSGDG